MCLAYWVLLWKNLVSHVPENGVDEVWKHLQSMSTSKQQGDILLAFKAQKNLDITAQNHLLSCYCNVSAELKTSWVSMYWSTGVQFGVTVFPDPAWQFAIYTSTALGARASVNQSVLGQQLQEHALHAEQPHPLHDLQNNGITSLVSLVTAVLGSALGALVGRKMAILEGVYNFRSPYGFWVITFVDQQYFLISEIISGHHKWFWIYASVLNVPRCANRECACEIRIS